MSTSPSPLAPAHAPICPRLSAFLKAHELPLIVILIAVLVWGVSGKVIGFLDARSHLQLTADLAASKANTEKTQAIADNNAKLAADYKQLFSEAQAQKIQLTALIEQRKQAVETQKTVDKALPPPALAQRWELLAALPANTVTPQPENLFSVTNDSAVLTVQALEELAPLRASLADETTIAVKGDQLLVAAQGRIDGLNQEIGGLHKQSMLDAKTCSDTITTMKRDATKSKRHWFVVGYIAGVISGVFVSGKL